MASQTHRPPRSPRCLPPLGEVWDWRWLAGVWLLLMAACSPPPPQLSRRTTGDDVSYSQVWQLATHNSYWAERRGGDPWVSGAEERILDQLLADGARTIELDIQHAEAAHEFRVYHLQPGDSQCDSLRECLGLVRTFQHALPQHRPLLLLIELKSLFSPMWDADHRPEDLDRILRQELGAALYTPGEYLEPCLAQGISTLRPCLRATGWPAVNELAGRVLVATLGYWHMFGGSNDTAWVDYSQRRPIAERAGFPLAVHTRYDSLGSGGQAEIAPEQFASAMANSMLWYSEDEGSPQTSEFVQEGGVVLFGMAEQPERQLRGIASGLQLMQTDTPWISADSSGPQQPLRLLSPRREQPAIGEVEAGVQLIPAEDETQPEIARLLPVAGGKPSVWEATLITGHDPQLVACLRAASQPHDPATSVTLCRLLIPNRSGPDSLRLQLRLRICQAGRCQDEVFLSSDGSDGGPGERVMLQITPTGDQTCVLARAARLFGQTAQGAVGAGQFASLGREHCLPAALPYQGLVREYLPGAGAPDPRRPVRFYRLSRNGEPLSLADFPSPQRPLTAPRRGP